MQGRTLGLSGIAGKEATLARPYLMPSRRPYGHVAELGSELSQIERRLRWLHSYFLPSGQLYGHVEKLDGDLSHKKEKKVSERMGCDVM